MDKKFKVPSFVSGAGKSAMDLLDRSKNKMVQVIDQNDDGKLDMTDVSVIADSVSDAMKKGAQAVKDSAEVRARELERKSLQPIFQENLDDIDFHVSKFIRVTDRDKKHAESLVCQGSIGYMSEQKGLQIVNIFKDSIDAYGLAFQPNADSEFYYVDPTDSEFYIDLDNYFNYLKIVRINELQKIAQDLGAKYFKLTYMEEMTSSSAQKAKVGVKSNSKSATSGSADAEQINSQKHYINTKIEAEMKCPGHAPIQPELKYMLGDPSIQNLIKMRMDVNSPLQSQKFMIDMSQSSGMKESDAMKIDAALKGMKCSGNTTVTSEAQNESRRRLEYEIRFDDEE